MLNRRLHVRLNLILDKDHLKLPLNKNLLIYFNNNNSNKIIMKNKTKEIYNNNKNLL